MAASILQQVVVVVAMVTTIAIAAPHRLQPSEIQSYSPSSGSGASTTGPYTYGKAEFAIDTAPNTFFHSANENGPYWEITLKSKMYIKSVYAVHRPDGGHERFYNGRIVLYDDTRASYALYRTPDLVNRDGNNAMTFSNINTHATRIRFRLEAQTWLEILDMDIQVDSEQPTPGRITYADVAAINVPQENSNFNAYVNDMTYGDKSLALDGSELTFYHSPSELQNNWMEIVLTAVHDVTEVRIKHRADCCPDRYQNGRLTMYDTAGTLLYTSALTQPIYPWLYFRCTKVAGVKSLKITLEQNSFLEVSEWNIYTTRPLPPDGPEPTGSGRLLPSHVAAYDSSSETGVCGHSSQYTNQDSGITFLYGPAEYAIDARPHSFSHTDNEPNPWIEFQFKQKMYVKSAYAVHRQDGGHERFVNGRIVLYDNPYNIQATNPCPDYAVYRSSVQNRDGNNAMTFSGINTNARSMRFRLEAQTFLEVSDLNVQVEERERAEAGIVLYSDVAAINVPAENNRCNAYTEDMTYGDKLFALDGTEHTFYHSPSELTNNWMEIVLKAPRHVKNVAVKHRADCCSGRFGNGRLTLYDAQDQLIYTSSLTQPTYPWMYFNNINTQGVMKLKLTLEQHSFLEVSEWKIYDVCPQEGCTPVPLPTEPPTPQPTPTPPTPNPAACSGACLLNACTVVGQPQLIDVTVVGVQNDILWGTGYYTDDSDVGAAAVHSNLIAVGETQKLTAKCLGPQSTYESSTNNGITSKAFGSWDRSFTFFLLPEDTVQPVPAPDQCFHEPCLQNKCTVQGSQVTIIVTGTTDGSKVWGSHIFTDDSTVGAAAVHMGLLENGATGAVTATCTGSHDSYQSASNNGVATNAYGLWQYSYSLGAGPATPPPTTDNVCRGACLDGHCTTLGEVHHLRVVGTTYGYGWGGSVAYTSDTDVGLAAAHASQVAVGQQGEITARCTGPQDAFTGSTANGITTKYYTAWPGSFEVHPAPSTPTFDVCTGLCLHNVCRIQGKLIRITVTGTTGGQVWGSSIYSDDSDPSTAAVHAGLVTVGETKNLVAVCTGSQTSFEGTQSGGVTSLPYGPWAYSFSLE